MDNFEVNVSNKFRMKLARSTEIMIKCTLKVHVLFKTDPL